MSTITDTNSSFWNYLSQPQKDLILEGNYLITEIIQDNKYGFKDYAFLVFPFAKAYEGFLKELFKDIGYISHLDYISDHLRLGKLMSPNLVGRLDGKSLYKQVKESTTKETADRIWNTWKEGRNQITHYYPHNYKAITFDEAKQIVGTIIQTMEDAYAKLSPRILDRVSQPVISI
ncbi:hypothetical protein HGB07_01625 [Candidatus Roizmanbacteria bacterium]|nr:hypothetical protein [Candidatus Roizmanbacteria bacterium]